MRSGGSIWNPWRELRAREHISLEWRTLPRGVLGAWFPTAGGATIVLASWLGRRARRCTLSHELIHDERGIGYSVDVPRELVSKEELWVARTSASRLVPRVELVDLVRTRIDLEEPVTVNVVAEHFDVTDDVALQALELLRLSCAS